VRRQRIRGLSGKSSTRPGTNGRCSVSSTVRASTVRTPARKSQMPLASNARCDAECSNVKVTSSAENGAPSDQVTPSRKVSVSVR